MHKLTSLLGLLLLIPCGVAVACPDGGVRCATRLMLVDARDRDELRYQESGDDTERGPLSVHVTTFDGSPSSPGMWYERPHDQRDDDSLTPRGNVPAAPFDRDPFDREHR